MKRKMIVRRSIACLAGAILLGGYTSASAVSADEPYVAQKYGLETLKWRNGPYVNLCNESTGMCQSLKMPKTLGSVERVVEGPFITSARSSWLAFSKFESFVCAAFQASTTVACAKIDNGAFPLNMANIAVSVTAENKMRITLAPRKAEVNPAALLPIENRLKQSLSRTTFALQGEVDHLVLSRSSLSTNALICDKDPRYPGPPPHPECELVDAGGSYGHLE